VAVKSLLLPTQSDEDGAEDKTNTSPDQFRSFHHEVYLMSQLDHPLLVKLYGVMLNPLRMVMEVQNSIIA